MLSQQYAQARLEQANYYADQIVEITDTERDPNRARVRVDARKWIASKMLPKVYGDMPVQTNVNVQNNVLVMGEDEQRKYQARLKALREERRPDSPPAQLKDGADTPAPGGAPPGATS